MSDIEREEMIEQAHKLYDDSRNLLSELRWQRTYFCRDSNIITKQEKTFNIWIFDECLKRLEERKVGKWIYHFERDDYNDYENEYYECPFCHDLGGDKDYHYCPVCGNKVKGVEDGSN